MSLERIAWNEMNNLYIHTQQCSNAKLWIKISKMESIIMIANFLVQNESKKEKKKKLPTQYFYLKENKRLASHQSYISAQLLTGHNSEQYIFFLKYCH